MLELQIKREVKNMITVKELIEKRNELLSDNEQYDRLISSAYEEIDGYRESIDENKLKIEELNERINELEE